MFLDLGNLIINTNQITKIYSKKEYHIVTFTIVLTDGSEVVVHGNENTSKIRELLQVTAL